MTPPRSRPPRSRHPSAARIGRATSGKKGGRATLTIAWTPPVSTGGSAVTAYEVRAYQVARGRTVRTYTGRPLPAGARRAVLALPKGTYRVAVRARNAVGFGPFSARSRTATSR